MNKEVEVDGYRYMVSHPDPETAFNMGVRFAKIIGEPVAAMAVTGEGPDPGETFAKSVNALLEKIDPTEMFTIITRVFRFIEVLGKVGGENKKLLLDPSGIKIHFRGRHGAMLTLAAEAIKFQQKDFFSAIRDGIAKTMKTAKEA